VNMVNKTKYDIIDNPTKFYPLAQRFSPNDSLAQMQEYLPLVRVTRQ
jgi:hypothetical protein